MKLSEDASLSLGLARTAIPFATSRAEEAERWLRVLRMHGDVGVALQALGVGEAPLEPSAGALPRAERPTSNGRDGAERVGAVASDIARSTGAPAVGTLHLLLAVVWVYDRDFDEALNRRGSHRDELLSQMALAQAGTR